MSSLLCGQQMLSPTRLLRTAHFKDRRGECLSSGFPILLMEDCPGGIKSLFPRFMYVKLQVGSHRSYQRSCRTENIKEFREQGLENRGGTETEKIEDGAQEMSNTFEQLVLVVS